MRVRVHPALLHPTVMDYFVTALEETNVFRFLFKESY